MNGVTIKIFYGIRYYDQEYDMSKWHYDYETIESQTEHKTNTGVTQGISTYLNKPHEILTKWLRRLLREE